MNEQNFDAAVNALTESVAESKSASDALQLLLADYYLSKAQIEDLSKKLTAVTSDRTLADVLERTRARRIQTITRLSDISNKDSQVLQRLAEAQEDIDVAKLKLDEYLEEYMKLENNVHQLKANVKGAAGGLIKSLLGPAAQVPPLSGMADKVFGQ